MCITITLYIVFNNLYVPAHSNGYSVALQEYKNLWNKKALRRERDLGRNPERRVIGREEGRAFHREGPMVEKF